MDIPVVPHPDERRISNGVVPNLGQALILQQGRAPVQVIGQWLAVRAGRNGPEHQPVAVVREDLQGRADNPSRQMLPEQ